MNLLSNGIKFTSPGGRLVIDCEATDAVMLRVSETGIGIPPDKLEVIFEPFDQQQSGPDHAMLDVPAS